MSIVCKTTRQFWPLKDPFMEKSSLSNVVDKMLIERTPEQTSRLKWNQTHFPAVKCDAYASTVAHRRGPPQLSSTPRWWLYHRMRSSGSKQSRTCSACVVDLTRTPQWWHDTQHPAGLSDHPAISSFTGYSSASCTSFLHYWSLCNNAVIRPLFTH